MDPVSGPRGRGRGRGRKEIESSEHDFSDTQSVASSSSIFQRSDTESLKSGGRGRGAGSKRNVVLEPFIASLDPSPVTLPDNPDEDDFLSAFRRFQLQTNGNGVSKGRGRGKSFPFSSCPSSEPDSGIASLTPRLVPTPPSPYLRSPPQSVAGASTVSDVGIESSDLEKATVIKRGEKGKIVPIVANFLRMNVSTERGLFEYHVSFEPLVESIRFKKKMVHSLSDKLGPAKMFDGEKLYLSIMLPNEISEYSAVHPNDPNQLISIRIMFVKKNNLTQCVHFYNVLFRRIMEDLGMIEMKRHFYNHRAVYDIPQHKLEIWPGFVTAIDEYEGGLMLCCDSSFRVLRTSTVLEIWYNFQCDVNKFRDYILGKIVLTRYNDKHYRVDDVLFKDNPCSTFENSKGIKMSYVNYYKEAYGLNISDLTQPLLVNLPKPNIHKPRIPQINLIPELCYVTGLDSTITSNYTIMKDVAAYTRLTPAKRQEALQHFIKNVNTCPEAKDKLKIWGLTLEEAGVKLEGRVLTIPQIQVNENVAFHPTSSNFGDKVIHNTVYDPVPVRNWLLLFSKMDRERARRMVDTYRQVCRPLGIAFAFSEGQAINVGNGSVPDYSKALDNHLNPQIQFVVLIIPHVRDDLYAMIKQKCTVVKPIPSQVILSKTLGNEKRLRSIMQKIALQINCKLGGSLWSIRIPLKEKIMFMGFDVYHDPRRRNKSVTAIVSSLNEIHTKYYSRVIFQDSAQETVSSLTPIIVDALQAYKRENSRFPDRVIVWRDGVSDGQLSYTKQHEVVQLTEAFKFMDFNPKFTFCVVQKRINARLLLQERGEYFTNPEPGTVVDHTVTRKYLYDFFLVSQLVREGTVSPTHYVVLEDNADINPDLIQKFAFATTFMYFNWTGSVRVPAMCQYAHKLASLVGQYVQREPSMELSKSLYYL